LLISKDNGPTRLIRLSHGKSLDNDLRPDSSGITHGNANLRKNIGEMG
jgi:hypothetical protein